MSITENYLPLIQDIFTQNRSISIFIMLLISIVSQHTTSRLLFYPYWRELGQCSPNEQVIFLHDWFYLLLLFLLQIEFYRNAQVANWTLKAYEADVQQKQ